MTNDLILTSDQFLSLYIICSFLIPGTFQRVYDGVKGQCAQVNEPQSNQHAKNTQLCLLSAVRV